MTAWSTTAASETLTIELLQKTFDLIKSAPREYHKHLVSPDGYRSLEAGGTAICATCFQTLEAR